MTDSSVLLALGAALSWTMAALVSHRPATELGSLHFNRVRMIVATLIMGTLLIVSGRPAAIPPEFWLPIMLSAVTGVVLGDFFLFVTMRRLGPRRTNVLFATNAVFAAIIGWVILGEVVSARTAMAVLLGFGGVVLAVVFGKRRDLLHKWESVMPPLWIGVVAGLLAAICQAFGVVFARPVMAAGVDPVAVTLARAVVGAAVFWATLPFDRSRVGMPLLPRGKLLALTGLNGLFGLGVGAAMLMAALETGNVATVTILSSTTPVMILPFIWARTGRMPAPAAWLGAILVVICTMLIAI
ncbi:MAG: DMT family transporter [Pseudomonadota bacterium]|nr:DMT family transporter [Pseudomonadota bacterium]MED5312913.1 DMT family transporter [Pseudomonadota bacterium]